MATIKVLWHPCGFQLNGLASTRYVAPPIDGDSAHIRVSIRLLSIDTPETNDPDFGKPAASNKRLLELADWIEQGVAPIATGLEKHLLPRLKTGNAGSLQQQHGDAAKAHFTQLLHERLTKMNGRKRDVFLYSSDETFDAQGRLLAYMAPHLSKQERTGATRDERKSFNLLMVESGWAAPFLIFPALPNVRDLRLFHEAAERAIHEGVGAWADPLMLCGYEWRMCMKLHAVTRKNAAGNSRSRREQAAWISRFCADMTTLKLYEPQDYYKIPPANRIFIRPKDVRRAVADLNLVPGE